MEHVTEKTVEALLRFLKAGLHHQSKPLRNSCRSILSIFTSDDASFALECPGIHLSGMHEHDELTASNKASRKQSTMSVYDTVLEAHRSSDTEMIESIRGLVIHMPSRFQNCLIQHAFINHSDGSYCSWPAPFFDPQL